LTKLTYECLSALVSERCPALREAVEKEERWWGEETPPPHVLFEDVVLPYLRESTELRGRTAVAELVALLEEMAEHADPRVPDVVRVSVLEPLATMPESLEQLRPALGPAVTAILNEIEGERRPPSP